MVWSAWRGEQGCCFTTAVSLSHVTASHLSDSEQKGFEGDGVGLLLTDGCLHVGDGEVEEEVDEVLVGAFLAYHAQGGEIAFALLKGDDKEGMAHSLQDEVG